MAERGAAVDDTVGEGEPAPTPAQDAVRPPGQSITIERTPQSLILQARVGLAVGILGLLVAAYVLVSTADIRADARARDDARIAGEVAVLRVSTFSGTDMTTFIADLASLATEDYAPEIERTFTPELQASLANFQVQSVGEILQSFVQDVNGDTAEVYVRVGQTFTVPGRPVPVQDQLDYEVTLLEVDGEWLVDNLVLLGDTQFDLITGEDGGLAPGSGEPAPAPDIEEGGEGQ